MLAKLGWKNVQGMFITNPGSVPGTDGEKAYVAALKADTPSAVGKPFVANSYDATFMLALAVEQAGDRGRRVDMSNAAVQHKTDRFYFKRGLIWVIL